MKNVTQLLRCARFRPIRLCDFHARISNSSSELYITEYGAPEILHRS